MSIRLQVSIERTPKRPAAYAPALPLLAPEGAAVIIGAQECNGGLAVPVVPSSASLFAPRGACITADGALWVTDTGHHRLLGWDGLPHEDAAPATLLIGQPTFACEGRNAKSAPSAATLNVPSAVAACAAGLAVADSWNHRVLLWHEPPRRHNQPADVILGQDQTDSSEPNRGRETPGTDTLFWPSGVAWDGARFWVADTGNRRVLVWNGVPARSGTPADLVLGQADFQCRDENRGGPPSAASMRWPHAIAFLGTRVCVADAGNNRLMIWQGPPLRNGQACDLILGQPGIDRVDHNQSDYWPSAAALNMPYAVTTVGSWLVAADTANSRLLAWLESDLGVHGAPAAALAGQVDWTDKGDNRWRPPARDSVCWPYGLAGDRERIVIADAGNNRVLLWNWSKDVEL
jgi:NHL repeat-containing protein